MNQLLWKKIWQVLKKKNILEFLCSLEVPPQVRYTDEQDAGVQADICTPMSTNSLCHNRKKKWRKPKRPSVDKG